MALPWMLFLLAKLTLSACSGPAPLSLPITDVLLPNGYTKRGIPGSIGSPAQNFSFMPQNFLNNTWVYNTSAPFCYNGTTDKQCLTQRGGEYDPSSSSTSHGGLDVYAAGGDVNDTDRTVATHVWINAFATDDIMIGNTTLSGFPVGMPGYDVGAQFDTQANIGLGRNSTILNALKDAGHVASRTYSYWWGLDTTSSSVAMDGQLVLGGYDSAKIMGPNVTLPLQPWTLTCPSGMYVTVTGLVLEFPNGTDADLLAGDSFVACLQLDFPVVTTLKGSPYYKQFENYTDTSYVNNSLGTYWFMPIYEPTSVFPGALKIVLSEEQSFTIPNDVLVVSDQYVGPSGAVETNSSASVVLIGPDYDLNSDDTAIFGMGFFSSAYLMVDLDAGTFTLWQANATEDSVLVPWGGTCSDATSTDITNGTASGSGTATSSGHDASTATSKTGSASAAPSSGGISTGAIIGAAIGGASVAVAIAVAIVLIALKRRRSAREAGALAETAKMTPASYGSSDGAQPEGPFYGHPPGVFESMSEQVNELSASQVHAHELVAKQRPVEMPSAEDMKPVEMPSAEHMKPIEMSSVQTPKLGRRE